MMVEDQSSTAMGDSFRAGDNKVAIVTATILAN